MFFIFFSSKNAQKIIFVVIAFVRKYVQFQKTARFNRVRQAAKRIANIRFDQEQFIKRTANICFDTGCTMKQTAGKKEHRPQMLSLRGSTPFLFLL